MIATISPTDYDETLSTLRYARAAKRIKNKAVVNEPRFIYKEGNFSHDHRFLPCQYIVLREIIDQIRASEKIMEKANETWQEKIQKTEEIQKERENTLEEFGIMIEMNAVGVHPPKKVPHLV